MVKLFGGTVTLGRIRKITFQEDDDKGERFISLFLLKLFKLVSFIIWVFCAYISLTTWLGQPISCFTDMKEIGTGLLNSYCLIQTREYQWIAILICLQSLFTLLPSAVWSRLEGGRLNRLLHKDSSIQGISRFLYEHPNWYSLSDGVNFYFSQLLCLGVSGLQIFLMDKFFGHAPIQSLLALTWPPPSLFTTMVSCNISYFGPTVVVQNISGMCTLNYNVLYDKVYLVLFITFSLLCVLSLVQVLIQTLLAVSPKLRILWMVLTNSGLRQDVAFRDLERIAGYPQFILYQLIRNNLVDPNDLSKIITGIMMLKKDSPTKVRKISSKEPPATVTDKYGKCEEETQSARLRVNRLEGLPESAV